MLFLHLKNIYFLSRKKDSEATKLIQIILALYGILFKTPYSTSLQFIQCVIANEFECRHYVHENQYMITLSIDLISIFKKNE